MSTMAALSRRDSQVLGCGLVREVREGSPEEVKLALPPGRLGEWKEGQCSWNAENAMVKS